ncbi:unnamed protein product [Clavelina lepadiformis]|uniref:C2H2-type domain-containing protein n=1 Tax=Clavelina lepadiformis TaxID=159417 RepID=A0ABP0FQE8_CLALP
MDVSASNVAPHLSKPDAVSMLLLAELKLMRKDMNQGVRRIEENFQNFTNLFSEFLQQTSMTLVANSSSDTLNGDIPGNSYHSEPMTDLGISDQDLVDEQNVGSAYRETNVNSDFNNGDTFVKHEICEEDEESALVSSFSGHLVQEPALKSFATESSPKRLVDERKESVAFGQFNKSSSDNLSDENEEDLAETSPIGQSTSGRLSKIFPVFQSRLNENSLVKMDKRATLLKWPNQNHKITVRRQNYVCKICRQPHASGHKLKRHYIEEHNYLNKYICQFCGKSCYNASDLKVHIRIHTGEKPFQCKICDKAFSDKSNYIRHCKRKRDLRCSACNKIFCTKFQFNKHGLTHGLSS